MTVSCVIPTRGDVDLRQIIATLDWCDDIVIWNNADREDLGIFARYAAIAEAQHQVIVTQDDDVVVTCWPEILAAYEPGVLTVNYPEPWDIPWVARGAIFDRNLPRQAFARYLEAFDVDDFFRRYVCDAVFGLLTPTKVIDHGSRDLPHGFAPGRVSTSPGWYDRRRPEIQRRCASLPPAPTSMRRAA